MPWGITWTYWQWAPTRPGRRWHLVSEEYRFGIWRRLWRRR